MSELWTILFSSSGILKSKSKVVAILKIVYLMLVLPFIIFAGGMALKSGFGSGKERAGVIKKMLVHLAALFWSFFFWKIIISVVVENLIK